MKIKDRKDIHANTNKINLFPILKIEFRAKIEVRVEYTHTKNNLQKLTILNLIKSKKQQREIKKFRTTVRYLTYLSEIDKYRS